MKLKQRQNNEVMQNLPKNHENLQIIFSVSIKEFSDHKTERSALTYYIIQKKIEHAIESAIDTWPSAFLATMGKGQYLVSIDPGITFRYKKKKDSVKNSVKSSSIGYIEKAVRFMEEHYYWDLTLEDVARQVYLSPSYLSRLFNRLKGCSVLKFLTQVRMEKACELLINTDYQISNIAGRVGYDTHHFSQVFKQNVGCTPTCYRRYAVKFR
ncbi:MAG: AraC family transcriptional regulator [Dehalobacterium sp.]